MCPPSQPGLEVVYLHLCLSQHCAVHRARTFPAATVLLIQVYPLGPQATRIKDGTSRIRWARELESRVGERTLVQQLPGARLYVKHSIHVNSPHLDSILLSSIFSQGLPAGCSSVWPLSSHGVSAINLVPASLQHGAGLPRRSRSCQSS